MKKLLFCLIALLIHCSLFATAEKGIFKEYDIRGIVGTEFQIEDTYEIACAIAAFYSEKDPAIRRIIVGADGRIHSVPIRVKIISALLTKGFDVVDIGKCTTPLIGFGLHTMPMDAGLMITASHNPGEYNGIKIYKGTEPVSGEGIRRIQEIYFNKQFMKPPQKKGSYKKEKLIPVYVEYIKNLFPSLQRASLHAIVDCGNGAAGTVMPLLVREMQWNHVSLLYPEIDGTFPHHIADPTVEKYMQDLKRELLNSPFADLGLGFDGDGDRMAPMTKSGTVVKGDQLLTIFAKDILSRYPGSSIIFDISSSKMLHDDVRRWGGNPVLSATGIAKVKRKMAETDAMIGGEISCHTIFKDRYFGFDDGIYTMMRLFELMHATGRSLEDLLSDLTPAFSSPTYRIPCNKDLAAEIINSLHQHFLARGDAELVTLDGLRVHLPYGWAIARASNTEPVISIRFEGNAEEDLIHIKNEFHDLIEPYLDCSILIN